MWIQDYTVATGRLPIMLDHNSVQKISMASIPSWNLFATTSEPVSFRFSTTVGRSTVGMAKREKVGLQSRRGGAARDACVRVYYICSLYDHAWNVLGNCGNERPFKHLCSSGSSESRQRVKSAQSLWPIVWPIGWRSTRVLLFIRLLHTIYWLKVSSSPLASQ